MAPRAGLPRPGKGHFRRRHLFSVSPDNPRIVRLFSRPTEIVPSGVVLLLGNKDRPGMVGYLGTLLGRYKVNIASMSLSRDTAAARP